MLKRKRLATSVSRSSAQRQGNKQTTNVASVSPSVLSISIISISISIKMIEARWRLFGHVLRMPRNVPAQMAIDKYFQPTAGVPCRRGRPRTTLQWCSMLTYRTLNTICNCAARLTLSMHLGQLATNRTEWSQLTKRVVEVAQVKLT